MNGTFFDMLFLLQLLLAFNRLIVILKMIKSPSMANSQPLWEKYIFRVRIFFPFYENESMKQNILLDIDHSGCFVFCGQFCCTFDAILLQLFRRARFVLEGRLFIALVWNLPEHRVQLSVLQSDGDARNLSSDRRANENSNLWMIKV